MLPSAYVDDVLLLGVTAHLVSEIRDELMSSFSMTDLGSASLVLGMEIKQGPDTIFISQANHVHSVLERFHFENSNPAPTPGTGQTHWLLLLALPVRSVTKKSLAALCASSILLGGTSAMLS